MVDEVSDLQLMLQAAIGDRLAFDPFGVRVGCLRPVQNRRHMTRNLTLLRVAAIHTGEGDARSTVRPIPPSGDCGGDGPQRLPFGSQRKVSAIASCWPRPNIRVTRGHLETLRETPHVISALRRIAKA